MTQQRKSEINNELQDLQTKKMAIDRNIENISNERARKDQEIHVMLQKAIDESFDADKRLRQNALIDQIKTELNQLLQDTNELRRQKSGLEQQETGLKGKLSTIDDEVRNHSNWVAEAQRRVRDAQKNVNHEEGKKWIAMAATLVLVGGAVLSGGGAIAAILIALAIVTAVYAHFKHKGQNSAENRLKRMEAKIDDQILSNQPGVTA